MFRNLPICPHCKKKVDFLYSLTIKADGHFICPECGKISEIKYDKKLHRYFMIACAISLVFLLPWLIFINEYIIFGLLLVLAPFIALYFKVPSLMILRKPKDFVARNNSESAINTEDKTIIMNTITDNPGNYAEENNRTKVEKEDKYL